jgi:hypothetical protein
MTKTVSNCPVTFRVIIPKPLNINGMAAPIRDAVIKDALAMGKDFEKVTRTWKGDVPRIQTEAKLVPPGAPPATGFHTSFTASAWPREDGSKGYWKWRWLDEGTKVRYAVMSTPFISKTRKGQLQSWVGKGKMLHVSKKHPMPGIEARGFTIALRKKWEQPFKDHMKAAVAEARRASGHAI